MYLIFVIMHGIVPHTFLRIRVDQLSVSCREIKRCTHVSPNWMNFGKVSFQSTYAFNNQTQRYFHSQMVSSYMSPSSVNWDNYDVALYTVYVESSPLHPSYCPLQCVNFWLFSQPKSTSTLRVARITVADQLKLDSALARDLTPWFGVEWDEAELFFV